MKTQTGRVARQTRGSGRDAAASGGVPHLCEVRLKSVYDALKRAERRAADYVRSHPARIRSWSIVQVARGAGCSEATLVRLARRLGYKGYAALKSDFRAATGPPDPLLEYGDITAQDGFLAVAEKVFAASIQSLTDTLSVLDGPRYEAAVEALVGARRIVFCGLGDAAVVALSAAQKFSRLDTDCRASADPDLQLIYCSHLSAGDVVVAVSHSGRSRPVLDSAREAARRGALVIGITNVPYSPLAKAAQIVLLTADFSEHITGEVISKRVSELCILESLYVNYLLHKGQRSRRALAQSNRAVGVNKI